MKIMITMRNFNNVYSEAVCLSAGIDTQQFVQAAIDDINKIINATYPCIMDGTAPENNANELMEYMVHSSNGTVSAAGMADIREVAGCVLHEIFDMIFDYHGLAGYLFRPEVIQQSETGALRIRLTGVVGYSIPEHMNASFILFAKRVLTKFYADKRKNYQHY